MGAFLVAAGANPAPAAPQYEGSYERVERLQKLEKFKEIISKLFPKLPQIEHWPPLEIHVYDVENCRPRPPGSPKPQSTFANYIRAGPDFDHKSDKANTFYLVIKEIFHQQIDLFEETIDRVPREDEKLWLFSGVMDRVLKSLYPESETWYF